MVHGLAFLVADHCCGEGSGREQFQLLDLVLVSRSAFGIVRCQIFSFTFKMEFFCFVVLQAEVCELLLSGDGGCCMISVALILYMYVRALMLVLKLTVEAEHQKPERECQ